MAEQEVRHCVAWLLPCLLLLRALLERFVHIELLLGILAEGVSYDVEHHLLLRTQRRRIRDHSVANHHLLLSRCRPFKVLELAVLLLAEEVVVARGDEACLAGLPDELSVLWPVVLPHLWLHLIELLEVLH